MERFQLPTFTLAMMIEVYGYPRDQRLSLKGPLLTSVIFHDGYGMDHYFRLVGNSEVVPLFSHDPGTNTVYSNNPNFQFNQKTVH